MNYNREEYLESMEPPDEEKDKLLVLEEENDDLCNTENFDDERMFRRMQKAKWISIILMLLVVAFLLIAILLARGIVAKGVEALKEAYSEAEDRVQKETEEDYYNSGYSEGLGYAAEPKTVGVEIGELREMSDLVVLTVSDTEFNIENTKDNKAGVASWIQMTGYADYTVDMTRAEFIVDSTRGSITVRIPEPKLGAVTTDYTTAKQLLLENKGLNDSDADGTAIVEQQYEELSDQIEEALENNEQNAEFAENEAITVVKNLLLELNPEIDSANVTVEYLP